jgi:hypothetical protein
MHESKGCDAWAYREERECNMARGEDGRVKTRLLQQKNRDN